MDCRIKEILRRIWYLGRRSQFDQELDDEIRFHIDMRAEELQAEGVSRDAALDQSRREFGSPVRMREDSRGAWQFHWFEDLCAADGRLRYRFKRPWRDGTTHIVMEPLELLERLSALVPAPRAHLTRHAGVLDPAAKWRSLIVPQSQPPTLPDTADATVASASAPDSTATPGATGDGGSQPGPCRHGRNYTWAELMKRVWELDVLACPRCLGRLKIVAAIHPPDATRKILECLGLPSRAPPVSPASYKYLTQPDWF